MMLHFFSNKAKQNPIEQATKPKRQTMPHRSLIPLGYFVVNICCVLPVCHMLCNVAAGLKCYAHQ